MRWGGGEAAPSRFKRKRLLSAYVTGAQGQRLRRGYRGPVAATIL
jgi:hypothetical protein